MYRFVYKAPAHAILLITKLRQARGRRKVITYIMWKNHSQFRQLIDFTAWRDPGTGRWERSAKVVPRPSIRSTPDLHSMLLNNAREHLQIWWWQLGRKFGYRAYSFSCSSSLSLSLSVSLSLFLALIFSYSLRVNLWRFAYSLCLFTVSFFLSFLSFWHCACTAPFWRSISSQFLNEISTHVVRDT